MLIYPSESVAMRAPVNLQPEDAACFNERTSYQSTPMSIRTYQDVTLSAGIGQQGGELLIDTIPHYDFLRKHFAATARYGVWKNGVSALPEGKYLLIHNNWCPGYYHWITEALPRLLVARELWNEVTLLLPVYSSAFSVVQKETLAPFDIKRVYPFPHQVNLQAPQLVVPSNTTYTGAYPPALIRELRDCYIDFIGQSHLQAFDFGEKIYITRRLADRRRIVNEDAVIELLRQEGFAVVAMEAYSFFEQVAIMHHAREVISIHGAGLTNMLFMKSGGRVLELQKRICGPEDSFNALFRQLAAVCDLDYGYQFCEPLSSTDPMISADLKVDTAVLLRNLQTTQILP